MQGEEANSVSDTTVVPEVCFNSPCRKYYFNVMRGAHMFGQWPGDLECGVRGSN